LFLHDLATELASFNHKTVLFMYTFSICCLVYVFENRIIEIVSVGFLYKHLLF